VAPFALTLFLSAFLLFLAQPMAGKRFLPLLGGSPAVWTTCMLFFQTVLLAAYGYAHALSARWPLRRQVGVHAVVLAAPFVALALGRPTLEPSAGVGPVLWLLAVLSLSVGPSLFALATTAPLLQRWFASSGHPAAGDPYFLYGASNLGSLAGLLAYPLALEPFLDLREQSNVSWIGYAIFAATTLVCATRARVAAPIEERPSPAPGWALRIRWMALAAVPSSLLLGTTAHLSTNLTPFPLLWTIPLALYLLTYVLAFARRPPLRHESMVFAQLLALAALASVFFWEKADLELTFELAAPLHLAAFFFTAMVCHGELASRRPASGQLTIFYLCMAVGGALGGAVNAILGPLLFDSFLEYPLVLTLACLLRPAWSDRRPSLGWLLPPVILGVLVFAYLASTEVAYDWRPFIVTAPAAALLLLAGNHPWRLALGLLVVLLGGAAVVDKRVELLHQERSFFGIHQVERTDAGLRHLAHGMILHGSQFEDEARRGEPLTYYHRAGPCGRIFETFLARVPQARVGVVGLGAGSVAAYAGPGQQWTFYEIDPAVERTARAWFTYLDNCKGKVNVVLGDGRLGIERARDREFDLLVFDAFSSDAIPVHLLTREALKIYLAKLDGSGLLAFHISSRYLVLQPILATLAADGGLLGLVQQEAPLDAESKAAGKGESTWIVLVREEVDLEPLRKDGRWKPLVAEPGRKAWRDDFTSLLSAIRWPWKK
jgi:hypothetical protein